MEKLVELLNEREIGEEGGEFYYLSNGVIKDDGGNILYDYRIISKEFGFIKWLVTNDKIDLDMVREKLGIPCCVWYGSGRIIAVKDVEDYKQILMLLSISDTPIKDLISYLK